MRLVSRKEWGARTPKQGISPLSGTRGVKVHYTGSHVPVSLAHSQCDNAVRGIQNGHMDDNGWSDIGYSAVVCRHGYVYVGRGPNKLPAANGEGLNSSHYAVCGLVGSSGFTTPSDEMLNGIRDAIEWLRKEGEAGNEIKGHRDGYATTCPGAKLYAWVKKGAPRPGGSTPAKPSKPSTPSKAPKFPGTVLIAVMRGHGARTWQAQMRKRGWSIAVDDVYGHGSEAVCRAFQKEKHLTVDGKVGPKTWSATWNASVTK